MKEVILHGELAEQFGGPYRFDVESPAEAVRALCSQLDGFEDYLRDGVFRIRKGTLENGIDQPLSTMHLGMGKVEQLHVIPDLEGGKRGGAKLLLGIALIGVSFLIPGMQTVGLTLAKSLAQPAFTIFGSTVTFGHIAMFGVSMSLGGIAQMMTPTPEVANYGDREQNSSFLFNGPENRAEQGAVVPIAYGLNIWVGSVVIHTSVVTEDIAIGGGGGYTDGPGTGGHTGGGSSSTGVNRYML